jgi:hypothetical protein
LRPDRVVVPTRRRETADSSGALGDEGVEPVVEKVLRERRDLSTSRAGLRMPATVLYSSE